MSISNRVYRIPAKIVAKAGLEPARPYGPRILSSVRLPITPLGHASL